MQVARPNIQCESEVTAEQLRKSLENIQSVLKEVDPLLEQAKHVRTENWEAPPSRDKVSQAMALLSLKRSERLSSGKTVSFAEPKALRSDADCSTIHFKVSDPASNEALNHSTLTSLPVPSPRRTVLSQLRSSNVLEKNSSARDHPDEMRSTPPLRRSLPHSHSSVLSENPASRIENQDLPPHSSEFTNSDILPQPEPQADESNKDAGRIVHSPTSSQLQANESAIDQSVNCEIDAYYQNGWSDDDEDLQNKEPQQAECQNMEAENNELQSNVPDCRDPENHEVRIVKTDLTREPQNRIPEPAGSKSVTPADHNNMVKKKPKKVAHAVNFTGIDSYNQPLPATNPTSPSIGAFFDKIFLPSHGSNLFSFVTNATHRHSSQLFSAGKSLPSPTLVDSSQIINPPGTSGFHQGSVNIAKSHKTSMSPRQEDFNSRQSLEFPTETVFKSSPRDNNPPDSFDSSTPEMNEIDAYYKLRSFESSSIVEEVDPILEVEEDHDSCSTCTMVDQETIGQRETPEGAQPLAMEEDHQQVGRGRTGNISACDNEENSHLCMNKASQVNEIDAYYQCGSFEPEDNNKITERTERVFFCDDIQLGEVIPGHVKIVETPSAGTCNYDDDSTYPNKEDYCEIDVSSDSSCPECVREEPQIAKSLSSEGCLDKEKQASKGEIIIFKSFEKSQDNPGQIDGILETIDIDNYSGQQLHYSTDKDQTQAGDFTALTSEANMDKDDTHPKARLHDGPKGTTVVSPAKASIKSGFVAISEIDEYYEGQSLDSDLQEDEDVELELLKDVIFDRGSRSDSYCKLEERMLKEEEIVSLSIMPSSSSNLHGEPPEAQTYVHSPKQECNTSSVSLLPCEDQKKSKSATEVAQIKTCAVFQLPPTESSSSTSALGPMTIAKSSSRLADPLANAARPLHDDDISFLVSEAKGSALETPAEEDLDVGSKYEESDDESIEPVIPVFSEMRSIDEDDNIIDFLERLEVTAKLKPIEPDSIEVTRVDTPPEMKCVTYVISNDHKEVENEPSIQRVELLVTVNGLLDSNETAEDLSILECNGIDIDSANAVRRMTEGAHQMITTTAPLPASTSSEGAYKTNVSASGSGQMEKCGIGMLDFCLHDTDALESSTHEHPDKEMEDSEEEFLAEEVCTSDDIPNESSLSASKGNEDEFNSHNSTDTDDPELLESLNVHPDGLYDNDMSEKESLSDTTVSGHSCEGSYNKICENHDSHFIPDVCSSDDIPIDAALGGSKGDEGESDSQVLTITADKELFAPMNDDPDGLADNDISEEESLSVPSINGHLPEGCYTENGDCHDRYTNPEFPEDAKESFEFSTELPAALSHGDSSDEDVMAHTALIGCLPKVSYVSSDNAVGLNLDRETHVLPDENKEGEHSDKVSLLDAYMSAVKDSTLISPATEAAALCESVNGHQAIIDDVVNEEILLYSSTSDDMTKSYNVSKSIDQGIGFFSTNRSEVSHAQSCESLDANTVITTDVANEDEKVLTATQIPDDFSNQALSSSQSRDDSSGLIPGDIKGTQKEGELCEGFTSANLRSSDHEEEVFVDPSIQQGSSPSESGGQLDFVNYSERSSYENRIIGIEVESIQEGEHGESIEDDQDTILESICALSIGGASSNDLSGSKWIDNKEDATEQLADSDHANKAGIEVLVLALDSDPKSQVSNNLPDSNVRFHNNDERVSVNTYTESEVTFKSSTINVEKKYLQYPNLDLQYPLEEECGIEVVGVNWIQTVGLLAPVSGVLYYLPNANEINDNATVDDRRSDVVMTGSSEKMLFNDRACESSSDPNIDLTDGSIVVPLRGELVGSSSPKDSDGINNGSMKRISISYKDTSAEPTYFREPETGKEHSEFAAIKSLVTDCSLEVESVRALDQTPANEGKMQCGPLATTGSCYKAKKVPVDNVIFDASCLQINVKALREVILCGMGSIIQGRDVNPANINSGKVTLPSPRAFMKRKGFANRFVGHEPKKSHQAKFEEIGNVVNNLLKGEDVPEAARVATKHPRDQSSIADQIDRSAEPGNHDETENRMQDELKPNEVPISNLLDLDAFGDPLPIPDPFLFDDFQQPFTELRDAKSDEFWDLVKDSLPAPDTRATPGDLALEASTTRTHSVILDLLVRDLNQDIKNKESSALTQEVLITTDIQGGAFGSKITTTTTSGIPISIEIPEHERQISAINSACSGGPFLENNNETEATTLKNQITAGLRDIFMKKVNPMASPRTSSKYDAYFDDVGKFVKSLLSGNTVDDAQINALQSFESAVQQNIKRMSEEIASVQNSSDSNVDSLPAAEKWNSKDGSVDDKELVDAFIHGFKSSR